MIRCQACGGNLFTEKDLNERYLWCLQCGRKHDTEGNLLAPVKPKVSPLVRQAGIRNGKKGKGIRHSANKKITIWMR